MGSMTRKRKKPAPAPALEPEMVHRFALLHADGSATVMPGSVSMDYVEAERRRLDSKVRRLADLSVIAEVEILVVKEYPPVATKLDMDVWVKGCPCSHCRGRE